MKPKKNKASTAAAVQLVSDPTRSITTPAHTAECAAPSAHPALGGLPGRGRRPLSAPEAIVIVIIILAAAALALAGLPVIGILELMAGAGGVAVAVITRRVPRLALPQSA